MLKISAKSEQLSPLGVKGDILVFFGPQISKSECFFVESEFLEVIGSAKFLKFSTVVMVVLN